MSKKPYKPRTKITPEMSLAQKIKAIRACTRLGGTFNMQHPEARAPRNKDTYQTWRKRAKYADKYIPNVDSWKRRSFTPFEIKQMYFALYDLMGYYGGNKKLAAKDMGINVKTLNQWIEKGRVTALGADMVGANPEIPFEREQLRPDITKKGWKSFDEVAEKLYARRDKQKRIGKRENNR